MIWWHSCSECSPLPRALFLVFPAAVKRTGFSGFLRSGMHTLCHGKEPVRVHRVQMLLKRNPRLSEAVVAWSHSPSSAGSFSAACASLLECCSHPLGTCFLTCLWQCRASAIPLTSVESCEVRRPGCPEARGCVSRCSAVELWVLWHLATSGSAPGSGCSARLGLPASEELRQWLALCWAHWLRS